MRTRREFLQAIVALPIVGTALPVLSSSVNHNSGYPLNAGLSCKKYTLYAEVMAVSFWVPSHIVCEVCECDGNLERSLLDKTFVQLQRSAVDKYPWLAPVNTFFYGMYSVQAYRKQDSDRSVTISQKEFGVQESGVQEKGSESGYTIRGFLFGEHACEDLNKVIFALQSERDVVLLEAWDRFNLDKPLSAVDAEASILTMAINLRQQGYQRAIFPNTVDLREAIYGKKGAA
jgi:hypothetical protein